MEVKHSVAGWLVERAQRCAEHSVRPLEAQVLVSVIAGERIGVIQVISCAPARRLRHVEHQNA